ncbi:MAG: glutaminyl-peptide cyclotransferase, partial [Candidatus Tectomicrobia bacterium]|nr:glutaminyl-peptide cyclotransferase [Candidatus Tectomicrobia bacterium]
MVLRSPSRPTGRWRLIWLISLGACLSALACSDSPHGNDSSSLPPQAHVFGYEVVRAYPHDRAAFTQGLAFDDNGTLYESTG